MKKGIEGMPDKYINSMSELPDDICWSLKYSHLLSEPFTKYAGTIFSGLNYLPGFGTLYMILHTSDRGLSKPYYFLGAINLFSTIVYYSIIFNGKYDLSDNYFNDSEFWIYFGVNLISGISTDIIAFLHDNTILQEHNSYYSYKNTKIKDNLKLSLIPINKGATLSLSYSF